MLFLHSLQHILLIYQWQDIFEIGVLSCIFYKAFQLLAHDTQKPLIRYFFIYLSLIFIVYTYKCLTLQILLLATGPAVLVFFIIIHQESLQRNFVALYRPAESVKKEQWHHHLIYLCQKLASKNQSTAFIIERQHNIEDLVHVRVPCHIRFSLQVFELLYSSSDVYSEHFLLVQHDGILRGINVEILSHSVLHATSTYAEKKLFLTAKTDALIIEMNATTLTFSCTYNNHHYTNISAHTMTHILDTFFGITTHSLKGTMYENTFPTTYNKTDLT